MAKSLRDVFQLARKMEMDGVKFYHDAAKKAANPQAKRLFESFALDEERHLRIVADLAKGKGVDVESMPMPAESIKTVFTEADAEAAAAQQATADETKAIRMAMEMERESYRLYDDAARRGDSEDIKVIFKRLAQEENQHYAMLENTQEYLTDNKKWFLWNEWALLTGDMSSMGE